MRARGVEELFVLRASCRAVFGFVFVPQVFGPIFAFMSAPSICLLSRQSSSPPRTRCDGQHKNTESAED